MASVALHGLVIAWLLLRSPLPPPAEQQEAPSFAVNFVDAGLPAPAPPSPSTQAEVNLGGGEMPTAPPPEAQSQESVPVPRPSRRYGAALRPRADRNPFAHVMPYDLSTPPQRSPMMASNGRSLDLSAGPIVRNGRLEDSIVHVRGSHGDSDWNEALREFVEEHKYYPRQAAENGDEGAAVLRATVARDGTVRKLVLVSSSGSQLLDAAWMAVFRDNRLPPFNDDMVGAEKTFTFELDYHLIYQH